MSLPDIPEAFSLYGEPLFKTPIKLWLPDNPEKYEAKIKELTLDYESAKKNYLTDPENPEKLLWYARKTEILGNFRESTGLYSVGIKKWPENPQFYRFRGHRFALLRRIDLAIQDFLKAVELITEKEDIPEVYASGSDPDKLGESSFKWNVYYHQGFTYFTAGMYPEAEKAYLNCMEHVDVEESRIATIHWLYMTFLRAGKREDAEKLLETVDPYMDLVEVNAYYDTLLMYKGHFNPEEVLRKYYDKGGVSFMVPAQAIANMYLSEGKTQKAVKLYKKIHREGTWSGGVHLIAEAELKALRVQL